MVGESSAASPDAEPRGGEVLGLDRGRARDGCANIGCGVIAESVSGDALGKHGVGVRHAPIVADAMIG
jgi:hypothetical protein